MADQIEMAAATLVAKAERWTPELGAWLAAVVGDPSYTDHLDGALADRLHNMDRSLVAAHTYPRYEREACAKQLAVYRLATAVVEYRREGRPSSEVTRDIIGLGGPIATVTTSLAAAVVEYVSELSNIHAIEMQALEDRLEDAGLSISNAANA